MDVNLSKLWEIVENRGAWSTTVLGVEKTQTWLSDWTTTADTSFIPFHQLSLSPFPSFLFLPLDDESYHIRPLIYPPMDSPFMGCILSTQQMPWGHCLPVCPHLGMPNPIWTLRSPVTRFFSWPFFLPTLLWLLNTLKFFFKALLISYCLFHNFVFFIFSISHHLSLHKSKDFIC